MIEGLLKDKNAIITGARRGIGRATVESFARNGSNVWACARESDKDFENDMTNLAEEYNTKIWPVYFDLMNDSEINEGIKTIRRSGENVDILVNAAGVVDVSTSFQMTPIDKMKRVMDVNFYSVTLFTQLVSRIMARRKTGSIVNIASIAGIDGTPGQYEYVASKAAIIGATRKLARELAIDNIRVNAIAPGIILTDMGKQIDESLKQEILSKVIMKRMGKPEEIANVIAFLASDYASYMTGQIIRVDGGM